MSENKKKKSQGEIDKLLFKMTICLYIIFIICLFLIGITIKYLPMDSEGYLDRTQFESIHHCISLFHNFIIAILLFSCICYIIKFRELGKLYKEDEKR